MIRMLFVAAALTAAAPPSFADGPADAKKAAVAKALETFADTWEVVAVKPEAAGKEMRRLEFRKDGTYSAQDKAGKELWGGTFDLDPTAEPKVWDHRSHAGKVKGEDVLGIYELAGDKLKIAMVVGVWKEKAWTGKPRPKDFVAEGADVMLELKRRVPRK